MGGTTALSGGHIYRGDAGHVPLLILIDSLEDRYITIGGRGCLSRTIQTSGSAKANQPFFRFDATVFIKTRLQNVIPVPPGGASCPLKVFKPAFVLVQPTINGQYQRLVGRWYLEVAGARGQRLILYVGIAMICQISV